MLEDGRKNGISKLCSAPCTRSSGGEIWGISSIASRITNGSTLSMESKHWYGRKCQEETPSDADFEVKLGLECRLGDSMSPIAQLLSRPGHPSFWKSTQYAYPWRCYLLNAPGLLRVKYRPSASILYQGKNALTAKRRCLTWSEAQCGHYRYQNASAPILCVLRFEARTLESEWSSIGIERDTAYDLLLPPICCIILYYTAFVLLVQLSLIQSPKFLLLAFEDSRALWREPQRRSKP